MLGVPIDVRTELRDSLKSCQIVKDGDSAVDLILLFSKASADLVPRLRQAAKALAAAGMLWISWPKKTSGVSTDLTENTIRETGLKAGLVDVKVCAITDVWSGLKFVIRVKDRPKIRNSASRLKADY